MDYLYDDTFEGLLTCIYLHYYEEKATGIYTAGSYQSNMLSSYKVVETDEKKATTVYNAIKNKISAFDLKRIYSVFLSSVPEKENKILMYVRLGFKEGPRIGSMHSNPIVFEVQKSSQKVFAEVHRFLGLVRFDVIHPNKSENLEILYGKIEPDNDIVELLATHFTNRFFYDPFIIHDSKRNKALIAKEGDWYVSQFSDGNLNEFIKDNENFPLLWKTYFETIAIKERINPKCQKKCMPARYWKNLTEMEISTS